MDTSVVRLLLVGLIILLPSNATSLTISADSLNYLAQERIYELIGNVTFQHQETVIKAQRAKVYESSLDLIAEGGVFYDDGETLINAERVELNLHTKTGQIHRAVIFFKRGNYWIVSDNLTKITEDRYYAESARFTTCNPTSATSPYAYNYLKAKDDPVDWCFIGHKVEMDPNKSITANDVLFKVRNLPIGYSPKIWAPVNLQRSTGLLTPGFGSSSKKGIRFAPAFFWAIDEDMDMTLGLDYYSKRGLGKSMQFRYIEPKGQGEFNVYHISDRVIDQTQLQLTAQQFRRDGNINQFLDINYVKSPEVFREYAETGINRSMRFLQSSGELSLDIANSRLYLLGQYWRDLKKGLETEIKRLPELGFFINPLSIGDVTFVMESTLSNLYDGKGLRAQRLEMVPTISHSFGDPVTVFQSLSIRESLYNLQKDPTGTGSKHIQRLQYTARATSRFVKSYGTFQHILEPSLQYQFIPNHSSNLFDWVEDQNNLSRTTLSLLSLMRLKDQLIALRLSQPYSLTKKDCENRLCSTLLQGAIFTKAFTVRLEGSYNITERLLETLYTDLSLLLTDRLNLTLGERYSRLDKISQYRANVNTLISKKLSAGLNIAYDSKGGGLRDSSLNIRYTEQCWNSILTITRRPGTKEQKADYGLFVMFELKGVGNIGKR